MTTAYVTLPDELQLARLVCSKLAMMIKGVLTVGFAALDMDDGAVFLRNQQKKHAAFIEVLHSFSGMSDTADLVREKADVLASRSKEFFDHFCMLIPLHSIPRELIEQNTTDLLSAYECFLQTLDDTANLLGMEMNFQKELQQGREFIQAFVNGLAVNESQNSK